MLCISFDRVSELRVVELLDGLCEKMQDYTLKKVDIKSYFALFTAFNSSFLCWMLHQHSASFTSSYYVIRLCI